MKIGYLTFGRDDFGYGLALCLSKIKGHELYRVTPKTAYHVDVLLFSCFWWEHIYCMADFLRRAGIKKSQKNRPRIIVGGFNTFNPVPLKCFADVVVCGDGEDQIVMAINGEDPGLVWHNSTDLQGFSHVTNGVTRIEVARGCVYKCKFCAVSHLKPFREVSIERVVPHIRAAATKKISAFSPEPTLHSKNDMITRICHKYGKTRLDTDVRLDRIDRRHDEGGLLRCGIEGISEKLRKSVGKGYSNDFIFRAVKYNIEKKRPGMLFYLIMDLPGETNADFEEFGNLLHSFETINGCENFLLVPSPSVFMPSPHTPMEYEEIHWDRDYREKWKNLFRPESAGRKPWAMQMAERTRIFSPASRVLSMISTRSGDEFAEIEAELSAKKIISISGGRVRCTSTSRLVEVIEKYGGVDKYCGKYTKKTAPWKVLKFAE